MFEVLLARSLFLLCFALIGCAVNRRNPFGNRCAWSVGALGARFASGGVLGVHRRLLTLTRGGRRGLLTIRGIFGYGAIMNCARPSCAVRQTLLLACWQAQCLSKPRPTG